MSNRMYCLRIVRSRISHGLFCVLVHKYKYLIIFHGVFAKADVRLTAQNQSIIFKRFRKLVR